MRARVSSIEAFREWREDEDSSFEDLRERILEDNPSEMMLAGTAGHRALQLIEPGEHPMIQANGFTFLVPDDIEMVLPPVREIRAVKAYGELEITGQTDVLDARRVEDHKFTGYFEAERFLRSFQWRFYLDIFEADSFHWNIFEVRAVDHRVYQVTALHRLVQYRYPGLHADCVRLAADFHQFAAEHLPGLHQLPEHVTLAEAA